LPFKPSALLRHRLLWGGGLALAGALAAGLFAQHRSQADAPPLPSSLQPSAVPAAAVESSERTYRPGAWYRYTLAGDQSVTVRAKQPGAQIPPPMHFQLKGEWRVGVCAASAETIDARVAFSPSDFSVDMGGAPLAPEVHRDLRQALSAPFFVTMDRAGGVRLIHFEHPVGALAQGLLRSVVASSQVLLPSTKRASWEASEEDSSGHYLARYQLDRPLQVDKRKLRYTHIVLNDGVQPVEAGLEVEVDARSTLTLTREDLWLESLQGEETVTVDPGSDMPIPSTHNRVEMHLLERGADPSLEHAFAARRHALLSLPMASPQLARPEDPMAQYRQTLAGRTLSDFTKFLRALPEEQKARSDALGEALNGLHALFVVEPATAAKVPGLLRAGLSRDAVGSIIGALSAATTKDAMHALRQIMTDRGFASDLRTEAIDAVQFAEAPTEEIIAALWRLARGSDALPRQAAILALGSVAMHLQRGDAVAAGALVDMLSRALGAAKRQEEQELWLGALGNTRSPRALPALQPFLTVSSAALRIAATRGLRFMPAPEADRLLSERLLSDEAVLVRSAAAFAAGYRSLVPLLPAVERALGSERDALVRGELVHLLAAQAGTSPEARRLLTWSSLQDPDATVRDNAAKALTNHALH
jgi:HEAT repeats